MEIDIVAIGEGGALLDREYKLRTVAGGCMLADVLDRYGGGISGSPPEMQPSSAASHTGCSAALREARSRYIEVR
jgi:hypothetical protein